MITNAPMKWINTTAVLALGLAFSPLCAPRAAAQAPKAPQDVHVTNAATDPVPVKIDGTTNTIKIDGTTNTIKIDGTTNTVRLAAGAAVQIGNQASSPALFRNVDRQAAQPVRMVLTATFNPNFGASTAGSIFTVPGAKRLVVEFVTVNITLPFSQTALFARLDSAGNFDQYLSLTPAGNDGAGKPNFIGTHRVFAIYEPGTIVQAFGLRNSGTDSGTVQMTISGYLVDI